MAPEYLVRGQLTEKVDIYSFGVLVLEIVCGRKNSVFTQDSGSILQTVRFIPCCAMCQTFINCLMSTKIYLSIQGFCSI